MSNVAKLVFVILILALIGSGFFGLSLLNQKTSLEQSNTKLQGEVTKYKEKEQKLVAENKRLDTQLKDAQANQENLQKQFGDLNNRISALSSERDDWKTKVEDLKRERNELMAKLQEKPQAPPPPPIVNAPPAQMAESPAVETPNVPAPAGQEKYWADLLKEKAALAIHLNDVQQQLNSGAVEFAELKKKNSDLEIELSQLKSDKEDIDRKIKYNDEMVGSLSLELTREKNDKRMVGERLNKLREENTNLRGQVKELSTAKLSLEKSIAKLISDKDAIEKKLNSTELALQQRAGEVMDIKNSIEQKLQNTPLASSPPPSPPVSAPAPAEPIATVISTATPSSIKPSSGATEIELPPIIVSAAANADNKNEASAKPMLKGKVLSINSENNFVVVDLGEEQGINVGDTLNVYRGSTVVTPLEVIQVRKTICAADIKQKSIKIQVGDSVTR